MRFSSWIEWLTSWSSNPSSLPPRPPCSGDLCHSIRALTPRFFPSLNPERYKVNYGPLSVPPIVHQHGETKAFFFNSAPPCTDCVLTHIQTGLEYTDGTSANINSGMYLRHVVVGNLERDSAVCPLNFEPFFTSGNERSRAELSANGTLKTGYYLGPTALLVLQVELLNMWETEREALLTIDWEWVPASSAEGFRRLTPVWLDIDGLCSLRNSEVAIPRGEDEVSLRMEPAWKADFAGEVVWTGGHLTDGGDTLDLARNGAVVCEQKARYGEWEEYVEVDGSYNNGSYRYGHQAEARGHLSSMTSCASVGRIEIGDEWAVTANYNLTKYVPMREGDGRLAPVMGINLMYVVKDGGQV